MIHFNIWFQILIPLFWTSSFNNMLFKIRRALTFLIFTQPTPQCHINSCNSLTGPFFYGPSPLFNSKFHSIQKNIFIFLTNQLSDTPTPMTPRRETFLFKSLSFCMDMIMFLPRLIYVTCWLVHDIEWNYNNGIPNITWLALLRKTYRREYDW